MVAQPSLAELTAAAWVPAEPDWLLKDLHSLGAQGRWPGAVAGRCGFRTSWEEKASAVLEKQWKEGEVSDRQGARRPLMSCKDRK